MRGSCRALPQPSRAPSRGSPSSRREIARAARRDLRRSAVRHATCIGWQIRRSILPCRKGSLASTATCRRSRTRGASAGSWRRRASSRKVRLLRERLRPAIPRGSGASRRSGAAAVALSPERGRARTSFGSLGDGSSRRARLTVHRRRVRRLRRAVRAVRSARVRASGRGEVPEVHDLPSTHAGDDARGARALSAMVARRVGAFDARAVRACHGAQLLTNGLALREAR